MFYNENYLKKGYSEKRIPLIFDNNLYIHPQFFHYLKSKLKKIKLTLLLEDFVNIPDVLKNQQFDKIYLSCLNLYIFDNLHGYNYFDKLKEYRSLLNDNGVIEGAYLYKKNRKNYENATDESSKKIPMKKVLVRATNMEEGYFDVAYLHQKNQR